MLQPPHRSLKTRFGLVFGLLALLATLVVGWLETRAVQARLEREHGQLNAEAAYQIASRLAQALYERYGDLASMAALPLFQHNSTVYDATERRRTLERLQSLFPQYSWIGVTDTTGQVLTATGGLLEGANVAARPWFQHGQHGPFFGDVHEALLLAKLLAPTGDEPLRFIDVALPILDATSGQTLGVLGAHLSFTWMDKVGFALLDHDSDYIQHEALILTSNGKVLLGPPEWQGQQLSLPDPAHPRHTTGYALAVWPDGESYLSGFAPLTEYRNFPGFDWIILVREHTDTVFAEAAAGKRQVLINALLLGALLASAGWLLASWLLHPIQAIAAAAVRIRAGVPDVQLPLFSRDDELAQLAQTLRDLVQNLTQQTQALRASEAQMRQISDNVPAGIAYFDTQIIVRYANARYAELFGWTVTELIGMPLVQAIGTEAYASVEPALHKVLTGQAVTYERIQTFGDSQRYLEVSLVADLAADGTTQGVHVLIRNITAQKQAEQALAQSEARKSAMLNAALDAIVTIDHHGYIVEFNPAAERCFGYSHQEACGQLLADLLVPPPQRAAHRIGIARYLSSRQAAILDRRVEVRALHRNGHEIDVELAVVLIPDTEPPLFAGFMRDVTERKRNERRIQYLATRDVLTGLPNRALLADRLQQALATARRDHNRLAVLFLDLDRFKTINDSLGHAVGDALLQETARRLLGCLRAVDTVARQGGDEFIVLLADLDNPDDAGRIAQIILHALTPAYLINNHEIVLGTSIGIALYPDDGGEPDRLLRHADIAMYHAKERGGNAYQFFAEHMNEAAQRRLLLEGALRHALEQQELELHYQPLVRITDGTVVGFEALARWQHPTLGAISPAYFIPIAEETGLIVPLGRWALTTACRAAQSWQSPQQPPSIAVNISARQFQHPDFVTTVRQALQNSGLNPQRLVLEITESVVMAQTETVIATLHELNTLGIELAIDDFGTGYSSLSYLRRLPIDTLKIDQSFIRDVPRDPDAVAIARAIIALAKTLSLHVIAEGVETPAQLDFLRELGCDLAQGYLLGRPQPQPCPSQRS